MIAATVSAIRGAPFLSEEGGRRSRGDNARRPLGIGTVEKQGVI